MHKYVWSHAWFGANMKMRTHSSRRLSRAIHRIFPIGKDWRDAQSHCASHVHTQKDTVFIRPIKSGVLCSGSPRIKLFDITSTILRITLQTSVQNSHVSNLVGNSQVMQKRYDVFFRHTFMIRQNSYAQRIVHWVCFSFEWIFQKRKQWFSSSVKAQFIYMYIVFKWMWMLWLPIHWIEAENYRLFTAILMLRAIYVECVYGFHWNWKCKITSKESVAFFVSIHMEIKTMRLKKKKPVK